jgi:hypothetical protein
MLLIVMICLAHKIPDTLADAGVMSLPNDVSPGTIRFQVPDFNVMTVQPVYSLL